MSGLMPRVNGCGGLAGCNHLSARCPVRGVQWLVGVCSLLFLYPAICGLKGHSSGGATAAGFHRCSPVLSPTGSNPGFPANPLLPS